MVTHSLTTLKVKIPEEVLNDLDLLVKIGMYPNRNEAIREAIRENLEELDEIS